MVAALAAPAAQADWTAPQTLVRPPLFDAFRIDGAGNAKGFEAFAWFHTTHKMRHAAPGRGGYLRYVRARKRLADGRLGSIQTVSRKDVIVDGPLVDVDRGGTTTVAWQEFRRGRRRPVVMAATARKHARFGAPVALGRGSANVDVGFAFVGSHLPTPLAVAPDGSAVLAWNDGRRIVAVRRPAGRCASRHRRACFGSVRALSRGSRQPNGPAAVIGTNGTASVTWSDGAVRIASARRGRSFGAPQRVSPTGQPATRPALAVGGDGDAVIAWRRAPEDTGIETGFGPIMAAARDAQGQISAAQTVDPGDGDAVDVLMNAQGEAILRWRRRGQFDLDVVAAARPPGGSFGTPVLLSPTRGDGELAYRQLAVDDRGRSIVGVGQTGFVRPAGGSFGPRMAIPGSRQLISAGGRFTTLWISGGAVKLSDLTS